MNPPNTQGQTPRHTGGGLRFMVLAALSFSVMSALVKLASERIPPAETVFARSLVGVILSAWMLRRAKLSWRGVRRPLLLMRGVLGTAGLLCFFYGISALPLGDATVLMYTNPIWTALIAAAALRERLSLRAVVAGLVALTGVVLVARPAFLTGDSHAALPLLPVLATLGAAWFAAGAYVSVRALRKTDHALVIVLWFPLIATPASAPLVAADPVLPIGWEWLVLIGIGVFVQVGQVAITHGLIREPAGRATAVSYVQIVFAYAWGIALFGETPDAQGLWGAALIVGAALWVAWGRARHSKVLTTPKPEITDRAPRKGD